MKSMTGYAALDAPGRRWELRAVNGRGLDLRLRLPDRPAGLEPVARKALGAAVARGNVTLSLRLGAEARDAPAPALDEAALTAALSAIRRVVGAAAEQGAEIAPPDAASILALRGVWEIRDAEAPPELSDLVSELSVLVSEFDGARASEGAALSALLTGHVDEIDALVTRAEDLAPERAEAQGIAFRAALARLEDAQVDEARIAQEIAVLAVRGDITEELDRLRAHVAAARGLIAAEGPVGRRLDFLTQEFNREANTLCAKAAHPELTAIGLELKSVIDRLREQVQNVE